LPTFSLRISLVDESVKSQTLNTYRDLVKLGKLADNGPRTTRK
jgi:hypothetical protein